MKKIIQVTGSSQDGKKIFGIDISNNRSIAFVHNGFNKAHSFEKTINNPEAPYQFAKVGSVCVLDNPKALNVETGFYSASKGTVVLNDFEKETLVVCDAQVGSKIIEYPTVDGIKQGLQLNILDSEFQTIRSNSDDDVNRVTEDIVNILSSRPEWSKNKNLVSHGFVLRVGKYIGDQKASAPFVFFTKIDEQPDETIERLLTEQPNAGQTENRFTIALQKAASALEQESGLVEITGISSLFIAQTGKNLEYLRKLSSYSADIKGKSLPAYNLTAISIPKGNELPTFVTPLINEKPTLSLAGGVNPSAYKVLSSKIQAPSTKFGFQSKNQELPEGIQIAESQYPLVIGELKSASSKLNSFFIMGGADKLMYHKDRILSSVPSEYITYLPKAKAYEIQNSQRNAVFASLSDLLGKPVIYTDTVTHEGTRKISLRGRLDEPPFDGRIKLLAKKLNGIRDGSAYYFDESQQIKLDTAIKSDYFIAAAAPKNQAIIESHEAELVKQTSLNNQPTRRSNNSKKGYKFPSYEDWMKQNFSDSPTSIIDFDDNEIGNLAALAGIDWSKTKSNIFCPAPGGKPVTYNGTVKGGKCVVAEDSKDDGRVAITISSSIYTNKQTNQDVLSVSIGFFNLRITSGENTPAETYWSGESTFDTYKRERATGKVAQARTTLTPEQIAQREEQNQLKAQERLEEKAKEQQEATGNAKKEWARLKTGEFSNEYFDRKKLNSLESYIEIRNGAYDKSKFFAYQLFNSNGEFHGLQKLFEHKLTHLGLSTNKLWTKGMGFVDPNTKLSLALHAVIGKDLLDNTDLPIIFGEGFATTGSGFLATNYPAVICQTKSNLESVVALYKQKYPNRPLIVLADNDHERTEEDGNVGVATALTVAYNHGVFYAIPNFSDISAPDEVKLSDFNDLHVFSGLEAVKHQINHANYPPESLEQYYRLKLKYVGEDKTFRNTLAEAKELMKQHDPSLNDEQIEKDLGVKEEVTPVIEVKRSDKEIELITKTNPQNKKPYLVIKDNTEDRLHDDRIIAILKELMPKNEPRYFANAGGWVAPAGFKNSISAKLHEFTGSQQVYIGKKYNQSKSGFVLRGNITDDRVLKEVTDTLGNIPHHYDPKELGIVVEDSLFTLEGETQGLNQAAWLEAELPHLFSPTDTDALIEIAADKKAIEDQSTITDLKKISDIIGVKPAQTIQSYIRLRRNFGDKLFTKDYITSAAFAKYFEEQSENEKTQIRYEVALAKIVLNHNVLAENHELNSEVSSTYLQNFVKSKPLFESLEINEDSKNNEEENEELDPRLEKIIRLNDLTDYLKTFIESGITQEEFFSSYYEVQGFPYFINGTLNKELLNSDLEYAANNNPDKWPSKGIANTQQLFNELHKEISLNRHEQLKIWLFEFVKCHGPREAESVRDCLNGIYNQKFDVPNPYMIHGEFDFDVLLRDIEFNTEHEHFTKFYDEFLSLNFSQDFVDTHEKPIIETDKGLEIAYSHLTLDQRYWLVEYNEDDITRIATAHSLSSFKALVSKNSSQVKEHAFEARQLRSALKKGDLNNSKIKHFNLKYSDHPNKKIAIGNAELEGKTLHVTFNGKEFEFFSNKAEAEAKFSELNNANPYIRYDDGSAIYYDSREDLEGIFEVVQITEDGQALKHSFQSDLSKVQLIEKFKTSDEAFDKLLPRPNVVSGSNKTVTLQNFKLESGKTIFEVRTSDIQKLFTDAIKASNTYQYYSNKLKLNDANDGDVTNNNESFNKPVLTIDNEKPAEEPIQVEPHQSIEQERPLNSASDTRFSSLNKIIDEMIRSEVSFDDFYQEYFKKDGVSYAENPYLEDTKLNLVDLRKHLISLGFKNFNHLYESKYQQLHKDNSFEEGYRPGRPVPREFNTTINLNEQFVELKSLLEPMELIDITPLPYLAFNKEVYSIDLLHPAFIDKPSELTHKVSEGLYDLKIMRLLGDVHCIPALDTLNAEEIAKKISQNWSVRQEVIKLGLSGLKSLDKDSLHELADSLDIHVTGNQTLDTKNVFNRVTQLKQLSEIRISQYNYIRYALALEENYGRLPAFVLSDLNKIISSENDITQEYLDNLAYANKKSVASFELENAVNNIGALTSENRSKLIQSAEQSESSLIGLVESDYVKVGEYLYQAADKFQIPSGISYYHALNNNIIAFNKPVKADDLKGKGLTPVSSKAIDAAYTSVKSHIDAYSYLAVQEKNNPEVIKIITHAQNSYNETELYVREDFTLKSPEKIELGTIVNYLADSNSIVGQSDLANTFAENIDIKAIDNAIHTILQTSDVDKIKSMVPSLLGESNEESNQASKDELEASIIESLRKLKQSYINKVMLGLPIDEELDHDTINDLRKLLPSNDEESKESISSTTHDPFSFFIESTTSSTEKELVPSLAIDQNRNTFRVISEKGSTYSVEPMIRKHIENIDSEYFFDNSGRFYMDMSMAEFKQTPIGLKKPDFYLYLVESPKENINSLSEEQLAVCGNMHGLEKHHPDYSLKERVIDYINIENSILRKDDSADELLRKYSLPTGKQEQVDWLGDHLQNMINYIAEYNHHHMEMKLAQYGITACELPPLVRSEVNKVDVDVIPELEYLEVISGKNVHEIRNLETSKIDSDKVAYNIFDKFYLDGSTPNKEIDERINVDTKHMDVIFNVDNKETYPSFIEAYVVTSHADLETTNQENVERLYNEYKTNLSGELIEVINFVQTDLDQVSSDEEQQALSKLKSELDEFATKVSQEKNTIYTYENGEIVKSNVSANITNQEKIEQNDNVQVEKNASPQEIDSATGRNEQSLPSDGQANSRVIGREGIEQVGGQASRSTSRTNNEFQSERGESSGAPDANNYDSSRRRISSDRISQFALDENLTEEISAGDKERFKLNINALKLRKELIESGKLATDEEKHVLSRYSGWGGFASTFNSTDYIHRTQRDEIKKLVTDKEYKSIESSALTSFYTPPSVMDFQWSIALRFGFKGGKVLDPSTGAGGYISAVPSSIKDNTEFSARELDNVTSDIARLIHNDTIVKHEGFEDVITPPSTFDLVTSNIPFAEIRPYDRLYNKANHLIHDYFIIKSLALTKPGKLVSVLTSSGTMDKKGKSARLEMAKSADLVAAIRLPRTVFTKFAGTSPTTDILVFKKLESPRKENFPSWVESTPIEVDLLRSSTDFANLNINNHFIENPEFILGDLKAAQGQRGLTPTVVLSKEKTLEEEMERVINLLPSNIIGHERVNFTKESSNTDSKSDSDHYLNDQYYREGNFIEIDGDLHVAVSKYNPEIEEYNLIAERYEPPKSHINKIHSFIELRNAIKTHIKTQLETDGDNEKYRSSQESLNEKYDSFVSKYGPVNETKNRRALAFDPDSAIVFGLEMFNKDTKEALKADIFSKRTINQEIKLTSAVNADEATQLSMAQKGHVCPDIVCDIYKDFEAYKKEMEGKLFQDPLSGNYLPSEIYLSGDLRTKIQHAEKALVEFPEYQKNIEALNAALPPEIPSQDIKLRLGASWIPEQHIRDFLEHIITGKDTGKAADINKYRLNRVGSNWEVDISDFVIRSNPSRTQDLFGTKRKNCADLLQALLSNRKIEVVDKLDDRQVVNKKETTLANLKAKAIQDEFKAWVWSNNNRLEDLTKKYNQQFNRYKVPSFDGSKLVFNGASKLIGGKEFKPRPNQYNGVMRYLIEARMLAAHGVGTGKTFTLTACCVEGKKRGVHTKALLGVPNNVFGQWQNAILNHYPDAKVLFLDPKSMGKNCRLERTSQIATGDWDIVLIAHSSLNKIQPPPEFSQKLLEQEVNELRYSIEEAKEAYKDAGGGYFNNKSAQRRLKSLEDKLKKDLNLSRKDDLLYMDEIGIDAILIDESDNYLNLSLTSNMSHVKGVQVNGSQRAMGLLFNARYIQNIRGNDTGLVFATGTDIRKNFGNTFVNLKFIAPDVLENAGVADFDSYMGAFGEIVNAVEISPEGSSYREESRLSKFTNLPEMLCLYRTVTDVVSNQGIGLDLPTLHRETILAPATEYHKAFMAQLANRAKQYRNGSNSEDNMLAIATEGRKAALDLRLVHRNAPDLPDSKINICLRNILKTYHSNPGKTQLVFMEFGVHETENGISLYDDLTQKLINAGIPKSEIIDSRSVKTDAQKKDFQLKMNTGDIRIAIGRTEQFGVGNNIQQKLLHMHELDPPWNPRELEQRQGRIERQGNENKEVYQFRYTTEDSFDLFMWEALRRKAQIIQQGKLSPESAPREISEDIDPSYAEVMAITTGNPMIREKIALDSEIEQLNLLRSSQMHSFLEAKREVGRNLDIIDGIEQNLAKLNLDINQAKEDSSLVLFGEVVDPKSIKTNPSVKKSIVAKIKVDAKKSKPIIELGTARGLKLYMRVDSAGDYELKLKGKGTYTISQKSYQHSMLDSLENIIAKLENLGNELCSRKSLLNNRVNSLRTNDETFKFKDEEKLSQLNKRMAEIMETLSEEASDTTLVDDQPFYSMIGIKNSDDTEKQDLNAAIMD